MATSFRKYLTAPGLIKTVYLQFSKIPDSRDLKGKNTISFKDRLMFGLVVFGLKCPSLLNYDRALANDARVVNLRNFYLVETHPSDTYLRERLDKVDPINLHSAFTKVFASLQRGKGIKEFEYFDGHVLICGDGTGQFFSGKVTCPQCCTKKSRNCCFFSNINKVN